MAGRRAPGARPCPRPPGGPRARSRRSSGRPWKTSSRPPGAVAEDALEVRGRRPGLDAHRLDPARHLDPLAQRRRRRSASWPRRAGPARVGREHRAGRRGPSRRLRSTPGGPSASTAAGSAARRPACLLHRRPYERTRSPKRPPRLKGTMVALTWGTWPRRRRSCRPCGRAGSAARPRGSRAAAAGPCTRCRRRPAASATSSMAARPSRRSGHSMMSRAGGPGPSRLHSCLELVGRLGVDVEVHGPQVVGREGPGVLDRPGRGQVEAVDQDDDDVAAQDRGLGRLGRARLEHSSSPAYCAVQPDEPK